jgi:hypothetical protein
MTEATAPPLLKRGPQESARRRTHPDTPTTWTSGSAQPVEIAVHDGDSARILLEYAAPLFRAEVMPGPAWTVRLQPPNDGGWILELLSLIERWLESARLPCAKVLYGGRSYLVRTSSDIARPSTVTDITSTPLLTGSRG